ncbi:hypothetical protein [Flavobacterium sp. JP2137]|uniref:hypothetical protein n=1 Tax=Flavobacterium sp. JP2137 TaxID=3414510 RepID=UPI003D2FA11A
MRAVLYLLIISVFMGCTKDEPLNEAAILGVWNLNREVVLSPFPQGDSLQSTEVLHGLESVVYEFKGDNQLWIKRSGKPDLLMRYTCYEDLISTDDTAIYGLGQYVDINESTYSLSYTDGKLILDAFWRNGPILYFERKPL